MTEKSFELKPALRGTLNPLDAIDASLRQQVFGQERAIEAIIRVLNRARFGFTAGNSRRPRATLLFLGPTGVGKTETARCLAHMLRPEGDAFLKIDCSLFSQGHEVSALVGAPPSYVGRDQKPLLNPDIIEQENSVILFDEIEKGQPELWNLLLQIMEDGEILLLNGGRRISFQKSIVILTTNVGAKEMIDYLDQRTIGFRTPQKDVEATGRQIYQIGFESLQKVFQPEWINRIDEIVAFRPLSSDVLNNVLDRMIQDCNNAYIRHGFFLEVTPDAKEYVLRKGFDSRFGARPLRQQLLKLIEAPFADLIASGGIPAGSYVMVESTGIDRHGEALKFFYRDDASLTQRAQELQAIDAIKRASESVPQPSVGLSAEQGRSAEHTSSAGPIRGPMRVPRIGGDTGR